MAVIPWSRTACGCGISMLFCIWTCPTEALTSPGFKLHGSASTSDGIAVTRRVRCARLTYDYLLDFAIASRAAYILAAAMYSVPSGRVGQTRAAAASRGLRRTSILGGHVCLFLSAAKKFLITQIVASLPLFGYGTEEQE